MFFNSIKLILCNRDIHSTGAILYHRVMYTNLYMETLVLDGRSYVKASKAAKDLGYATDYVGQLCRSGKVSAHLIGRTWYVNTDDLASHRTEKKRMSRVKARAQAHKSIEEHRIKISKTSNVYKNIDIQYEKDTEELIPQTRKLAIKSEHFGGNVQDETSDSEQIIENKGEKILMSGKLSVTDMTDGVDSDTTLLTPTRIQTHHVAKVLESSPKNNDEGVSDEISEEVAFVDPELQKTTNFGQKLQTYDISANESVDIEPEIVLTGTKGIVQRTRSSILPYILVFISMLFISATSIFFSVSLRYTNEPPQITTSYNFSFDKTVALLRIKI